MKYGKYTVDTYFIKIWQSWLKKCFWKCRPFCNAWKGYITITNGTIICIDVRIFPGNNMSSFTPKFPYIIIQFSNPIAHNTVSSIARNNEIHFLIITYTLVTQKQTRRSGSDPPLTRSDWRMWAYRLCHTLGVVQIISLWIKLSNVGLFNNKSRALTVSNWKTLSWKSILQLSKYIIHIKCQKNRGGTVAWDVYIPQIARFIWPRRGPPGSCRPQVGPMLAPWTFLTGTQSGPVRYDIPIDIRLIRV